MRILFATTAGAGHFGPLIPFAKAAVDGGHDVVVAAPGPFEGAVRGAGFDFRPLGEADQAARGEMFDRIREASFDEANLIMLRDGFLGLYPRGALPGMLGLVEDWRPDVILREGLEYASLVAAERLGVPHVEVRTGLGSADRLLRRATVEPLSRLLESGGVATDRPETTLEDTVFTATPLSLEEAEDRASAHAFRTEVPAQRGEPGDRPLIFATLGSEAAAMAFFPDFYRALIGVLASTGAELVVALGRMADPAALGPLPPGVRAERWVDQAEVLSRAAATVFHGGYGTMIGSLAASVPLIGLPLFSIDQRINVERMAAVGLGLALDGPQDLASLAPAVGRVLTENGFRDRAIEVANEIASLPPPSEALSLLERVA
jgi:UDP:flavonoid glycosyltransferase YjiC (YdhE family)